MSIACSFLQLLSLFSKWKGAGIAQWLERRTRDWKVACSNPCWSGGIIFLSRVNFLCWLLFRYSSHARVTAVARKRSRSSWQKCRWKVTAKHAYTWRMWFCMKWHGAWLYGAHGTRRNGVSFMWYQPCQRCQRWLQSDSFWKCYCWMILPLIYLLDFFFLSFFLSSF